ncbi:hypothetical protein LS482_00155 [Sinomicrobium kalidii]|uniref:beta strand repeat-containing protein n=1 Tax=Sinomicrobium kalidii TaxID=2900738 RepID=UPI001E58FAA6|nr:hypothetical protein [Sinomicrobium kalidii]UGU16296.1 hypothetical protein LS482_00155 [Sinomicrobium kalidii]
MMKQFYAVVFFLVITFSAHAQVGIGTSLPDNSAQLDVVADNKGVLIPRVALTGTTDQTTIANGNVESLLVFNTADTADIRPGYYYWYAGSWHRVVSAEDVAGGDLPDNIVIYNPVKNEFTYIDENGVTQIITLEDVIKANETITTLINNGDGTYTYTSEDGTETIINVPADVINQFDEIIRNEKVINKITELFQNTGGNVYYDGNTFTYTDEKGETQTINFEELVKSNETVTTLVNNQNGTYTYTSEDGTETIINVPADVINQFEEIIQNENVVNEITELIENVGGNVYYDGNQFTYVDENGETQVINLEELVQANETVTTLVNNQNGTYTYTSEDGTETIINVPADVINQFEEIIQNENVVNEITELIENVGGNVYYDGNQFTYLDENGETQVINLEELVQANETVTTLINNQNGTYTYTSEDGTETIINVPADVINQFEEIIQNENVVNEITELIENVGGNVYYDGNTFTYVDENGETQTINIEELVKANETVTTLINNQNGTYTYTSEDGTETIINVPADVINQFEEIIQNENVVNEITELIENVGGNVYYDGNQFTYLDENGETQVINLEELVQANETVTTLINNQNGTYTYTSEDGTETIINVPADVINQFEEIIQNENVVNEITELIENVGGNVYYDGNQFTYVDENGETQVINLEELVQANETVTTLINNQNGTYTYTSEDGTETIINVPADVINQFEEIIQNENVVNEITELIENVGGNVYYDGNQFTYVDENGETQVINLEELVQANETVTTLLDHQDGTFTYTNEEGIEVTFDANTTSMTDNNDGTYTFTNANGDTIIVDVPSSVVENITNEGDIFTAIENLIKNIGGNVYYDGNSFTYIDENGETQTINFEEIVKSNETVTTLVNNQNGTYTYTSEDGTETIINVPADVINQFEEIIQNENVVNEITELIENVGGNVYYDGNQFTYLDENGETQVINLEELVQANETVTTLVNNQNGTYTYTSEDGTETIINVPADVINQFEEIIQNENVVNEITELIENVGGNVYYDGNQFTYLDENGETQVINLEELVQANETVTTLINNQNGTYTYTSEDGTETIINVPADVINQFEEIIQNENVVNEITELIENVGGNVYYDGNQFTYVDENGETQVINLEELVQANETVTTLINNQNGTYTYTSEDGTETIINVPADVINQFEEIIQNENVVNEITELIENVGGNVYYDGNQFTYVDENGETQVINLEELVQANETVTTLLDHQDGTFTYTNEEGIEVTFDANTTSMTDNNDGTYTFTNANGDTIIVDVPSSVVENITNEGDIFTAIENLIKNIGGNVYYDGNSFTYIDENGETQTINFEEIVKSNETVTTLVNNQNGTYTYTSEDGTETIINVPADVINQFEEIIQNENVVNEITELIENVGGNVYYDGNQFTYLDENGETQVINLEELVQANETVTTLVNNQNGTYTYTSEDGTETIINVPADVINQFEEIIQNENVVNEITELIENVGGNVYYDGNQFTYVDENGETQVINLEELVQANETVTTLINNQNGTYTYTSEDGTETIINVPADVINQFEEIIQNENVVNEITELIENVGGNVYYDGNQFTYLDENGETQVINLEELVQANETVTTLLDHQDGTFTYTNEEGIEVTFDANTTSMTDNNDGTYTFTNANGDSITVDVPSSVVDNITNEGDIFNAIENLIKSIGGNVYYDGNQFTYIDENGTTQEINFEELVQANETLTSLVDNGDGTITYTDEASNATIIKSVMPKFFYMPSVAVPTEVRGTPQTLDLYSMYSNQFGTPMAKNSTATTLPVLPAGALNYYITYYDDTVFESVSVSDAGVLTYTVKTGAEISSASFMNIVFEVK